MATSRTTGRDDTTQRDIRPCAVSVRTRRRSSCRSRTVSTTRSSTSAVLPPVSRCSAATSATCSRSLVVHPLRRPRRARPRAGRRAARRRRPARNSLRGLGRVVDHDRERADEAVSGAERRGEHVEVVRQLLGEQRPLPLDLAPDRRPRPMNGTSSAEQERAKAEDRAASSHISDDRADQRPDRDAAAGCISISASSSSSTKRAPPALLVSSDRSAC